VELCGVVRDMVVAAFDSKVVWLEVVENGRSVDGFVGF